MDNFYNKENVGLELSRNGDFVFIGKFVSDEHFASDRILLNFLSIFTMAIIL